MYFQLGSMIGAVLGWMHGRPGRGDARGAWTSLPMGGGFAVMGWIGYPRLGMIFPLLSGLALGYGVAFLIRRTQSE